MPRRESTSPAPAPAAAGGGRENVQYIVKGSSPVFSALAVVTTILLLTAVVLQSMELHDFYDYGWLVFVPPSK